MNQLLFVSHAQIGSSTRALEMAKEASLEPSGFSYAVYQSPLGPIRISASKRGVVSVKMLFGKYGCSSVSECSEIGTADEESKTHLKACITWLDKYFHHSAKDTMVSIPALDFRDKG